MADMIDAIYDKALPYLDTRRNDVHIALSYDFARKLLEYYPEADPDVVLPGIILHDVGWKMVPEEKLSGAFGPKAKDGELRRFHEIEGVRIAEEILRSVGCPEEKIKGILVVIDGHDTREEAVSVEDRLVKDADKLWRFTPTGVDIDHRRFGIDRVPYMDYLEKMIGRWFFTPEARKMAGQALAEAREKSDGEGSAD